MASLIERQIDDWERRGIVNADTARSLRLDVGASLDRKGGASEPGSGRHFSFFQVVAFCAAISFAAAVLLLIASNWELIPRLARVGGVMALIFAGFAGGAVVRSRSGSRILQEACYFVAGAAFVGGVALVAQMYHISGDERDAALTYALALGLSSFAVRSRVLVAAAVAWLTYWHMTGQDAANLLSLHFLGFVISVAAAFIFAAVTGSRWLRRGVQGAALLALVPFAWATLEWLADLYLAVPDGARAGFWGGIWILSLIGLAAEKWQADWADRVAWRTRRRLGTFFVVGLIACAFLHGELGGDDGLLIAASMTILFVLLALYGHGREHRTLRYGCYVLFVGEVLVVYGETAFSMLGTSGFFLALALFLSLIAFAVYRIERRARAAVEMTGEGDV